MNTLVELWKRAVRRWPHRPAVCTVGDEARTYAQLDIDVHRFTAFLQSKNVRPGQHVGLIARNSPEAVAAYFGILRAGAVVVPINHSAEASLVQEVIDDSAVVAVVEESIFSRRLQELGSIQRWTFDEAATSVSSATRDIPGIESNGLASIVYTSGSTDRPLGVMLSQENLTSNALAIAEYMQLRHSDRILCVLPLYYIYGLSLLLSHVAVGGATLFDNRFMFPQLVAESLESTEATGFAGVSTHYHTLLDKTDFAHREYPHIRYWQHAGDKMPQTTSEKLLAALPSKQLYLMYGQTEASPRLSFLNPEKVWQKPNSVGQAIPGVELRTVNESGGTCDGGEEGEVIARGPNITRGYWNCPSETETVLKDGWLYTGDTGYFDEQGDLFITGRKKLFVKVGGRRVSLAEVEAASSEFAPVMEAVAVGEPDKSLGQRIKLFVVGRKDDLDVDELLTFLKLRLPSYKVPTSIEVMAKLPKKSNGKLDRSQLT